jgi:hypothetical protein
MKDLYINKKSRRARMWPCVHAGLALLLLALTGATRASAAPVSWSGLADPIPFETVKQGTHGEFCDVVVFLAGSVQDWDLGVRKVQQEGAIWVLPGPEPPDSVAWGREWVLLVAGGGDGTGIAVRAIYRVAGRLCVELDYSSLSGPYPEYCAYHLVKFEGWPSLKSFAYSGNEACEVLRRMGPPSESAPPGRDRGGLGRGKLRPSPRITASPNPSVESVNLSFSGDGPADVLILSVAGRTVRRLTAPAVGDRAARWTWDGRSDDGGPVPPGIYYACVATPEGRHVVRLVRLR